MHAVLGCLLFAVSGGFVLSTYVDSLAGADEEVRKAGIAMGVSEGHKLIDRGRGRPEFGRGRTVIFVSVFAEPVRDQFAVLRPRRPLHLLPVAPAMNGASYTQRVKSRVSDLFYSIAINQM